MAQKMVTIAEFARQMNVTSQAVRNAIARQTFGKCLKQTRSGPRLPLEAATTEWTSRPKGAGRPPVLPPPPADSKDVSANGMASFNDSRAKREHFAALREETLHRKEAGELVEAEGVLKRWVGIVAVTRSKILAVPSKIKARIPDLTLDQVAIIDAIVREALEELSEGRK